MNRVLETQLKKTRVPAAGEFSRQSKSVTMIVQIFWFSDKNSTRLLPSPENLTILSGLSSSPVAIANLLTLSTPRLFHLAAGKESNETLWPTFA